MNNADGVPQGVVIVSTNAGIKGTEAEQWKQNAVEQSGKRWSVHLWSHKAPWLSDEDVEEAKRRDPVGMEYDRLWEGKWISGVGGAVDEDSIDRCFRLEGPLEGPESGWQYLAAFDLGISHDHSGIIVIGVNERDQRAILLHRSPYWWGLYKGNCGNRGNRMKIRVGFVSNSSSSSFIAIVPIKIHEQVLGELHPFATEVVKVVGEEMDVLGQKCFVTAGLYVMDVGPFDGMYIDFDWGDDEDDEDWEEKYESEERDPEYIYDEYLARAKELGTTFTYTQYD